MLEPSIAQMMQSVNNRYLLVNVVAQRTRDIAEDAREEGIVLEDKPLSLAIQEVSEGRVQASI